MGGSITASDTPGGGLTILVDLAAPVTAQAAARERSAADDRAGDDAERSDGEERRS
jgi:hypothetical protein